MNNISKGGKMKGKRLSMREIRKILEYRFDKHISAHRTALALKKSKGSIINTVKRFHARGLSWPLPADMTDTQLESLMYSNSIKPLRARCPLPDCEYIQKELCRPHVTLQRLWEEYYERYPEGLSRSSFYRYVHKHQPVDISMKQHHKGGDKLFVDYSGDSIPYIDLSTGELIDTELFVCCWGASSYCYLEATETQKQEDFASSHRHAFEYFGIVPHALVPDNLKSAVVKADRYNPLINRMFGLLCEHYDIVALPARVRKPRDKGVVESNVLHVQRTILARLRNRQFFSIQEINTALREETERFNNQPMKDYGGQTRRMRFESLDMLFAKPLPEEPFKIVTMKDGVKVARDYHISFNKHYYSVPYQLAGKRVEVRQVDNLVEIYHDTQRVACHKVSKREYGYTTRIDHMPKAHQYVHGWSTGYFLDEAGKVGQSTYRAIEILLKRSEHVEQGYRAARGILQLAHTYSASRLEKACERALLFKNVYCSTIKSILKQGLDKKPVIITQKPSYKNIVAHENIRGAIQYQ